MTEHDDLQEIGKQLTSIDVDDASAQMIAHRARRSVGRGPSPRRFVEPVLVAIFATSFFAWALLKVIEVFR